MCEAAEVVLLGLIIVDYHSSPLSFQVETLLVSHLTSLFFHPSLPYVLDHILLRPGLTQIPLTPLSQSQETRNWAGRSQIVTGGILVEVSA